MISYVVRQVLKSGFYEVEKDFVADLPEDTLIVTEVYPAKALKTVFESIMDNREEDACDIVLKASTILRAFADETSDAEVTPVQPLELKFKLDGVPLTFQFEVVKPSKSEADLNELLQCLTQIKSVPDICHSEVYQKVFGIGQKESDELLAAFEDKA